MNFPKLFHKDYFTKLYSMCQPTVYDQALNFSTPGIAPQFVQPLGAAPVSIFEYGRKIKPKDSTPLTLTKGGTTKYQAAWKTQAQKIKPH